MNTDNFLIEKSEIEFAQNICNIIADTDTRNRAVANAFGAKIAEKFFDKDVYKVDSTLGLHNIGIILDEFDISDIYINNSYIDVRLFFNEEELSVPKSHFDNNLLPVAYMFVRITQDLSNATVTGFIAAENINKAQEFDGFYPVEEAQLVSFYDIEPLLVSKEDSYAVGEGDIFAFLDNKIEDKNAFIRELIESENGRLKFAKAVKAQYAFNFVSFNQEKPKSNAELDLANGDNLTDDDLLNLDNENMLLDEQIGLDSPLEESNAIDNLLEDEPLEEITDLEPTNLDADEIEIQDEELDTLENNFDFSTVTTPSLDSFSDNIDSLLNDDVQADAIDNIIESVADNTEDDTNENSDVIESQGSQNSQDDKDDMYFQESNNDDNIQESSQENDFIINSEDLEEDEAHLDSGVENDAEDVIEEVVDEENDNNSEQISTLFNSNEEQQISDDAIEFVPPKKSKSSVKLLAVIGLLVVIGAVGYFGYNQFANQQPTEDDSNLVADSVETQQPVQAPAQDDAMPVESVEGVTPKMDTNEGTSEAIPAIEQNLDASILVSNLKVDWEVPAGYASSTSAKRYLVKLGKVIQLNLKTELLLLNKPPISNKIAVEIKYNNGTKKFEAVGITQSSGEKTVDDLILQTVNKALAMNLSTNFDSFGKLQGNPVLIIHL